MKVGDEVKVIAEFSGFYNNVGVIVEEVLESDLPYTVCFAPDDEMYFSLDELEVIP